MWLTGTVTSGLVGIGRDTTCRHIPEHRSATASADENPSCLSQSSIPVPVNQLMVALGLRVELDYERRPRRLFMRIGILTIGSVGE